MRSAVMEGTGTEAAEKETNSGCVCDIKADLKPQVEN